MVYFDTIADTTTEHGQVDLNFDPANRRLYYQEEAGRWVTETDDIAQAVIVGSRIKGETNLHRPVIDIDVPARLIPSTTSGHFHLYLDGITLTTRQYRRLLRAMVRAGLVERGYYDSFVSKKQTYVRLPWKKKKKA